MASASYIRPLTFERLSEPSGGSVAALCEGIARKWYRWFRQIWAKAIE